jgi:hypothetical protein
LFENCLLLTDEVDEVVPTGSPMAWRPEGLDEAKFLMIEGDRVEVLSDLRQLGDRSGATTSNARHEDVAVHFAFAHR